MGTISGEMMPVVLCRMVKVKALRTLEACKKCDYHKGIEELRPAGQLATSENPGGLPPSYVVICGLPTKEMVIDLIIEGHAPEEFNRGPAAEGSDKGAE